MQGSEVTNALRHEHDMPFDSSGALHFQYLIIRSRNTDSSISCAHPLAFPPPAPTTLPPLLPPRMRHLHSTYSYNYEYCRCLDSLFLLGALTQKQRGMT